MTEEAGRGEQLTLDQARELIARQAGEIERLREALSLAATAGIIGSPVTHARLLEMIVETAAHVIGARAGALFLLDEERGELTFEVAIGSKAQEVKRFRVPVGQGIAGIVAASGQAMAISDAADDPRLATDIVESVGYAPRSLLCVPLFYGSRIIGSLELLDKETGRGFGAADIEALSLFANQAAVALQLSRTYENIAQLLHEAVEPADVGRHAGDQAASTTAGVSAAQTEEGLASREALELASLVSEIAQQGESERQSCHAILLGFAEYLRGRAQSRATPRLGP